MKSNNLKHFWLAVVPAMIAAGAPAPVGAVNTTGRFLLNGVETADHASLSDGALLETPWAASEVHLAGGAYLVLAKDTKAQIHGDRVALLNGSAQISKAQKLVLTANGLRVVPGSNEDAVLIAMNNGIVRVGALKGKVTVLNAKGGAIAQILPGKTLAFQENTAAPLTMKMKGTVSKANGKYFLKDETSNLLLELVGDDLGHHAGHVVELNGTVTEIVPTQGAAYVVRVDQNRKSAPATVATGTVADTGAGSGISLGTATVVGGVAVAGTGAATAIVLAHDNPKPLSH